MERIEQIFSSIFLYKEWEIYIAATSKGLCFLGTNHSSFDELTKWCEKQFPNYHILRNEEKLYPFTKELTEYFNGNRKEFTVPLDIRGTAFQMSVWKALLEIPYAQTNCYSDVASAIRNPKAIRAVGGAIGANPVSIVIPCHRVIGKNGSLTGYSGGLDVKERLLQLEGIKY